MPMLLDQIQCLRGWEHLMPTMMAEGQEAGIVQIRRRRRNLAGVSQQKPVLDRKKDSGDSPARRRKSLMKCA